MNTMLKEGRLELWNQCVRKTEAIASNMVLGYEVICLDLFSRL